MPCTMRRCFPTRCTALYASEALAIDARINQKTNVMPTRNIGLTPEDALLEEGGQVRQNTRMITGHCADSSPLARDEFTEVGDAKLEVYLDRLAARPVEQAH